MTRAKPPGGDFLSVTILRLPDRAGRSFHGFEQPVARSHKLLRADSIRSPAACCGMRAAAGHSSRNRPTIIDFAITRADQRSVIRLFKSKLTSGHPEQARRNNSARYRIAGGARTQRVNGGLRSANPPYRLASTASCSTFVTTRDRPSCRNRTAGDRPVIWVECEAEYFLRGDWTTQISLIWFGKLGFSRMRSEAVRQSGRPLWCRQRIQVGHGPMSEKCCQKQKSYPSYKIGSAAACH